MAENEIKDKANEFFEYTAKFGQKYPEIAQSFMALMGSVMEDGTVKTKEKELIALGIAVGLRCLPCIYAHTSAALNMGATPEEIMEAASVAIRRWCGRSVPRRSGMANTRRPASSSMITHSSGARSGPGLICTASAASIRMPGITITWTIRAAHRRARSCRATRGC